MIDIKQMISSLGGGSVYIQTHNFPDPDALASAMGLQYLLGKYNVESIIVYKGKIDHGSSYAMVQKLNIEVMEYDDTSDVLTEESRIILVDAQKGNANILDMPGKEIACFDHHPIFGENEYKYSDIRPDVGACASIISKYILDEGFEPTTEVATALLYGIKIDTANLTRGVSKLDLDMFYYLYNKVDKTVMASLDNSIMRNSDLKAYSTAINSIKTIDRVSYANTGINCQEALIAAVSDFIMMLDTTDSTVVYSIKDDGIKISVRTVGKFNAGLVAKKALEGIGSGGGHEHMAGGFVPYDANQKNPVNNRKYLAELTNEIEHRFANAIYESVNCKK